MAFEDDAQSLTAKSATTSAAKSTGTAKARANEDAKNFLVWGSWHGMMIEKPLLTEKVRGAVQKTLIGKSYCVVLRTDGVVVSWGESKQGCLGLGPEQNSTVDPHTVRNLDERVIDIVHGSKHILALTVSGRVFAWGNNEYGQLGVGDVSARFSPSEVPGVSDHSIKQILAVDDCSFAVSEKGDVFGWGDALCGLLPVLSEQDHLVAATPLLSLHPFAIRQLEVVHGENGQKTLMAYIDYFEKEAGLSDDELLFGGEDPTGGNINHGVFMEEEMAGAAMEASGKLPGWGLGGAPAAENKDAQLFQGIHMLRDTLDTTKNWYEEMSKLRHGAPYEIDAEDNFLIKSNPVASDEDELKKFAAAEVTAYDLDANGALEVLYSALTVFDKFIKQQDAQNKETRKVESASSRFIGALFRELCLLRREKVQRTILARDMVMRKRNIEQMDRYARNGTSQERFAQCITQLSENAKQIRQAASRHDTALLSLQNALVENCELRISKLEMEMALSSRVVEAGAAQTQSIQKLRQVWSELKNFSLTPMLEEIDETLDAKELHQLLRMVNNKIDAALDGYGPENQLFGQEAVLPNFLYELLIENGELRKAWHSYQLRTLIKERYDLRAEGLAAANKDALGGATPR